MLKRIAYQYDHSTNDLIQFLILQNFFYLPVVFLVRHLNYASLFSAIFSCDSDLVHAARGTHGPIHPPVILFISSSVSFEISLSDPVFFFLPSFISVMLNTPLYLRQKFSFYILYVITGKLLRIILQFLKFLIVMKTEPLRISNRKRRHHEKGACFK